MIQGSSAAAAVLETIANTLWQGGVIVALTACLLRWGPRATATARHAIWAVALAATLLLPLVESARQVSAWVASTETTRLLADHGRSLEEPAGNDPRLQASRSGAAGMPGRVHPLPAVPEPLLALSLPDAAWPVALVAGLLLFGIAQLLRVGLDVLRLRRLASQCVPLDEARERRLAVWRAECAAGRRKVRLCLSPEATQPMLVGLARPTIVIPVVMASQLSDADLDHVALHELGHARRWDDWAKLGQCIARALLFFHPGARWAARRMDIEAEKACDAWVVARTGARRAYASCLVRIGELAMARHASSLAPGALTRRPQLSQRVEALLAQEPGDDTRGSRPLVLVSAGTLALLVAAGVLAPPAFSVSRALAPPSAARSTTRSGPVARAPGQRQSQVTDQRLRDEARGAVAQDDTSGEDREVRRILLSALGDDAGTAIVMDPTTGHLRAVVNQEWATRRTYHPASLVKIVTALAALQQGAIDPTQRVRVMLPRPRTVDMVDALVYSSTDYFQHAGERAGLAAFLSSARALGLGQRTDIDLPGETAGRIPSATTADAGALYGAGVGVEVTPIQLAVLVAAIANGGTAVAPRHTRDGTFVPRARWRAPIAEEARERLIQGMVGAVERGTAISARDPVWSIAGKTGTWQDDDGLGTGLFVSFAPVEAPRFVVVVVTQGRGERGASAARVAGPIYRQLRAL